jgi:type I restriction enzyme S subunit
MGEVANIPQLRFPEFSNEWEESKVGKVFKVSAGGDIKTENVSQIKTDGFPYPIYANAEKAKGLYGYSNLYKSEANVVTVAGRGVNIGIAHVRLEPFYPIVRLLVLNPIKDADVKFWENQLNQLNLFVESTGVPQLTAPQISSYKVKYPSKPEQQKIAAFLTAVDNKIEQLSKKQELLGEYKKGLMQQIFSQAIRFKADDGSDFPDWEEKKLGDVSDCLDNRRQPLNGAERNQMKGDIPYYGANGIVDYVNDYIFDEELVLLAEDGGNFNDFSSKPIAQKISGKAWVNNHAHILKAKNIIATDFLFYSLVHKDIRRYIVGGSRAKLI